MFPKSVGHNSQKVCEIQDENHYLRGLLLGVGIVMEEEKKRKKVGETTVTETTIWGCNFQAAVF